MTKPFFPIKLPGARLYSEEVEVRQFGPDEVSNYDRVRRSGSDIALRNLVGGTLKGITIDDLYEPDLTFIMLWHRVNSFQNFPMKLPWECPMCENKNDDSLDVTKVVSKEVSEDYDPQGMTFDMPCGVPVILRLPKVNDELKARRMLNELSILNPTEEMYRKAEMCMLMEYDENFNSKEKWEMISKHFGVEDVFVVEGFKNEFSFGPATSMSCTCKKCGGQLNVGFRFSIMEFLPNNLDGSAIRARILSTRPTRHDAKRAKELLFSKASLDAQAPSEETGGTPEGKGPDPRQHKKHAEEDPGKEVQANEVMRRVTPEASKMLVGRLLEEARHEVQEERTSSSMEPGGPVIPGQLGRPGSAVKRK